MAATITMFIAAVLWRMSCFGLMRSASIEKILEQSDGLPPILKTSYKEYSV